MNRIIQENVSKDLPQLSRIQGKVRKVGDIVVRFAMDLSLVAKQFLVAWRVRFLCNVSPSSDTA